MYVAENPAIQRAVFKMIVILVLTIKCYDYLRRLLWNSTLRNSVRLPLLKKHSPPTCEFPRGAHAFKKK